MMVNTPDYIEKMIDQIIPWIEVDVEKGDFHLRSDAPKGIVDAKKKVDEYGKKHYNPFGFEE